MLRLSPVPSGGGSNATLGSRSRPPSLASQRRPPSESFAQLPESDPSSATPVEQPAGAEQVSAAGTATEASAAPVEDDTREAGEASQRQEPAASSTAVVRTNEAAGVASAVQGDDAPAVEEQFAAETVDAVPGPIFLGAVGFDRAFGDQVEPEEELEYELEVKRPTTCYFDIVRASRRATYTLLAPDGSEVFRQEGSDFGPMTLEPGLYTLRVTPQGNVPISFELRFARVG